VLRSWALLGKLGQAAGGQTDGAPPHLVILHHTDCGIRRLAAYPELLAKLFEIPVAGLDTKPSRIPTLPSGLMRTSSGEPSRPDSS
jgi:carbonic anhydrase